MINEFDRWVLTTYMYIRTRHKFYISFAEIKMYLVYIYERECYDIIYGEQLQETATDERIFESMMRQHLTFSFNSKVYNPARAAFATSDIIRKGDYDDYNALRSYIAARIAKKIHAQISGNNFVDQGKKPINMNGAISKGSYVYITNTHYIGRILVPDDNAEKQPIYYDYEAGEDSGETVVADIPLGEAMFIPKNSKSQEALFFDYLSQKWKQNRSYTQLLSYNMNKIKKYFTHWRPYCLKLKKNRILEIMHEVFGNSNTKLQHHYVTIERDIENLELQFTIKQKSAKRKDMGCEGSFKIPMHMYKRGKQDLDVVPPVSLCAMYFMRILEVFEEYDIIDLAYSEKGATDPNFVTIKGVNPRNEEKPDIRFILAWYKGATNKGGEGND